jgi:hypothetical protein
MDDNSRLQTQIMAASVDSGKAMGSADKKAGKDGQMNELFKLNQVYYNIPPSLSLVSKRCITRCQFQQTSYNNPVNVPATLIFNTGEFHVSGCTSFLVIQMGIDRSRVGTTVFPTGASQYSNCHALLGQGNLLNLIQEVTFTSASGTEVDRQQEKGLQSCHVARNMNSQQFYDTAGELQGYPGGPFHACYDGVGHPGTYVGGGGLVWNPPFLTPIRDTTLLDSSYRYLSASAAAATAYDITKSSGVGSVDLSFDSTYEGTYNPVPGQAPFFVIPLSDLLGCFNPYMRALIPPAELAGGRLDIRWKQFNEGLIATGAGLTTAANASAFLNSIQVYNIYLMLDSFQMNDSVLKRLNEVAAGEDGLSVMFDTWDWAQTSVSILNFEAQVSQARSRILRSFCVIRDSAEIKNPFGNSLASEAAVARPVGYVKQYTTGVVANAYQQLVNNYQAQLGSLYFPQQPITTVEEFCMNAYYTFSKNYCNTDELNAVTLDEFMGAQGVGHFAGGIGTIVVPSTVATTVTAAQRVNTILTAPWTQNWGSATYGFLAERSQLLQLTGLPISNARLLRHRFVLNYAPLGGSGRQVDVFTQYTRVAKVFLGGRIVMRE